MKKLFYLIIIYILYTSILPIVFLSGADKGLIVELGRIGKFLSKFVPASWINDKVFHLLFFLGFTVIIFLIVDWFLKIKRIYNAILITIYNLAAIFLIEEIQPIFNRSYELRDIIFGVLGVSLALNVITLWCYLFPSKTLQIKE